MDQDEADIEDFFGLDLYLKFVNRTYGQQLELMKVQALAPETPRIEKKVAAAFKLLPPEAPEFDHYGPARWLLENPNELRADTPETRAMLDRFEDLFRKLNALLPR